MSVRPTPNPRGSGYCDICSYDPVLNVPQDIIDADPNAFTWYTETTAGAFPVSFGAHSGKLLREVPECYLVWTQMVAGNCSLAVAAQSYWEGLQEFEQARGIAFSAADRPGADAEWNVSTSAGGHVMNFGRYRGWEIKDVPLLYLFWTRGDLSSKCFESTVGTEYFAALNEYIQGLMSLTQGILPVVDCEGNMVCTAGAKPVILQLANYHNLLGMGRSQLVTFVTTARYGPFYRALFQVKKEEDDKSSLTVF